MNSLSLREVVELFLADTPARLAALHDAVERGDATAVEREAHTLKGSAANVGALRLAVICEQLQRLGRARDLAPAPPLLARLDEEYGWARAALAGRRVGGAA